MAFSKTLFIKLSIGFIAFTVIGTISHELGHFLSAKLLGFQTHISYGSTRLILSTNQHITKQDYLLFIMGGPLQTIITGTLGFSTLVVFRDNFPLNKQLPLHYWLLIFCSLFWLRQSANSVRWVGQLLLYNKVSYEPDEIKIAQLIGLPIWSLTLPSGGVGLLVLAIIIFRFLPVHQRPTFMLSVFLSGPMGYCMWMYVLGPIIMPK